MYGLGSRRSVLREIFEYSKQRAAETQRVAALNAEIAHEFSEIELTENWHGWWKCLHAACKSKKNLSRKLPTV